MSNTMNEHIRNLQERLAKTEARVVELEAELRAALKWAKRMGYIDLQERLGKLLATD